MKRKIRLAILLFLGIAILMGIQNTEKDLVMAKNNIIKYSVQEENTKTKKVPLDDTVAIANPGKYKDMDYGFLKDYNMTVFELFLQSEQPLSN